MNKPKRDQKPSETPTEPAMRRDELDIEEVEGRMADYLLTGDIDGMAFDGDPADLDWF